MIQKLPGNANYVYGPAIALPCYCHPRVNIMQLSVCGYHFNHNLWLLVCKICHLFKLQQIKNQNRDESLIVDTFFINERKNDSGQTKFWELQWSEAQTRKMWINPSFFFLQDKLWQRESFSNKDLYHQLILFHLKMSVWNNALSLIDCHPVFQSRFLKRWLFTLWLFADSGRVAVLGRHILRTMVSRPLP